MQTIVLPETPSQEHLLLIRNMAWTAFYKICKPTSYEIDDLIQEGYVAWINARNSFKDDKGATFTTWVNYILRNHFYDMVEISMRKWIPIIAVEDLSLFLNKRISVGPSVEFMDFVNTKMSNLEKQYVVECARERSIQFKGFRERVRRTLEINEKAEYLLRDSIKEIFSNF